MKLRIDIDHESGDLIQWLATACQLTVSDVIDKLISGHLSELWELRTFMESHSLDVGKLEQAANLLTSYGGGVSILDGIKRIAPDYATLEARFANDLATPLHYLETAL
ncbi:hypothetical protein LP417_03525 [Polaromonas sp. P1-6]|nr:hypothetical protein LP417_03525 [Polaromonas sp. P1-6]